LADHDPGQVEPAREAGPDSTVGTGSVIAIGCTLLTLLLTLIGVAIFIARQIS
jgi:hypothetical protein